MADPVIRLDKSKPFSTCHGERTPDDPHYRVHFWQGGRFGKDIVLLPFDAHGELIPDDGRTGEYQGTGVDPQGRAALVKYLPLWTDLMRKYYAAKIERLKQLTAQQSVGEPALDDDDNGEASPGDGWDDEVNFEQWLRGEVRYQPHLLRNAARKRFSRQFTTETEMVTALVLDEEIMPEDQVCERLRRLLPKKEAA